MTESESFDEFCIISLLDHKRTAGRVSELDRKAFIRVDVPATKNTSETTYLIPIQAIQYIELSSEADVLEYYSGSKKPTPRPKPYPPGKY
ncbi:hypothetical protein JXJ21_03230 [candidate division KSB1 bacterium]|nr:hypothetical protein [candidate division KSB1 bacterium]